MNEIKLLFAGPMGAGKTTAIRAISEVEPIATEVANTDLGESAKNETTVAMDYGELTLDTGEKLRLYGSPGQRRFDFMWRLLADGALGVVVLLDNSRPDPFDDLEHFLKAFEPMIAAGRVVIAPGRLDTHPEPSLDDYMAKLDSLGHFLPVVPADVRRRDDVLRVLDVLFEQIELAEAVDADTGGRNGDDEWMHFVQQARPA